MPARAQYAEAATAQLHQQLAEAQAQFAAIRAQRQANGSREFTSGALT